MKKIISILFLLLPLGLFAQDIYQTNTGNVSFFSSTPVEDIDAHSKQLNAAINVKTRKFAFRIPIKSFEFKKSLMQEHFNENYMESEKYPKAMFDGEIIDDVDLTKPGTYKVKAKGKLNIHGVEQERIIDAVVTVTAGEIKIESEFKVKLVDHKIEVPKLVFQNIAEEIQVKVNSVLKPAAPKK